MDIVDLQFTGNETTQERLIKATQALIASYGYDAMTTRMIANTAGVSLSAINFHFNNKEELTRAAVTQAAEQLSRSYMKAAAEVREFLDKKPVDREAAWGVLDRFLTRRIRRALNYEKSWINIGIAEHENGLPESSRGIMADVAVSTSEAVLAELIEAVSVRPDPYMAMIMARSINATMMTVIEKPLLLSKLAEKMELDIGDRDKMEMALHDYFMRAIEANVTRHPWQK
ncbi:MAG: TetR/AcrR family transcriptional regulator [Candidatus Ventricola sp.]